MANDGAITSEVEAWMVATVQAASDALAAALRLKVVGHYEGSLREEPKGVANELFTRGLSFCLVQAQPSQADNLGENDQRIGEDLRQELRAKRYQKPAIVKCSEHVTQIVAA